MTHLGPAEIIDAAEGVINPDHRRHLQECARCSDQVREAAAVLGEVRAADAPEPSPLFWDRFSARVSDRISQEGAPLRRWSPWIWAPAGVLAASIAIVIGLSNAPVRDQGHVPVPGVAARATVDTADQRPDDPTWTLVSEVTDDIAWDDAEAAGLGVKPGAAEHAVMQLSDDQRQELVRLLQDEMVRLKS